MPRKNPGSSHTPSKNLILHQFDELWTHLFAPYTRLDSLLSKLPEESKPILSKVVPWILRTPCSLAEELQLTPTSPWHLQVNDRVNWPNARKLAEKLIEKLTDSPNWKPLSTADERDFPPLLLNEWNSSWGPEKTHQLCMQLGSPPPLSLRASKKRGAAIVAEQLTPHPHLSRFAPFGLVYDEYTAVMKSPAYVNGDFEIQDEGSQWMALFALWPEIYGKLLTPQPQQVPQITPTIPPKAPSHITVIDTCAGAGGKTLAVADAMGGRGKIFAYDVSEVKLRALKKRATRAGLNNIKTLLLPEEQEAEALAGYERSADVVLVDAPCTGWGVLRRNPDIKWKQTPEELRRLPAVQFRILDTYSMLVAPGGRLGFGLCTIRPSESSEIVDQFLKAHPEFKRGEGGYLGPSPCDGFFMQCLEKEKKAP